MPAMLRAYGLAQLAYEFRYCTPCLAVPSHKASMSGTKIEQHLEIAHAASVGRRSVIPDLSSSNPVEERTHDRMQCVRLLDTRDVAGAGNDFVARARDQFRQ